MNTSLEATLAKLIAIRSVSADAEACREVIRFVHDEIKSLGLYIQNDLTSSSPWLVATTKDTRSPDILLVAHLDVVPANDELFTLTKRHGNFYGRGVYDMKFAAACYLEFAKKHADTLADLNIGFLFTTDEETGSDSMQRIIAEGWRPKLAFIPDGGDNWSIEERAKGLYNLEIAAHGKTAHASRPWEGVSAMNTLLNVLSILRTEYPDSSSRTDTSLAVTVINGGESHNQIPDYAKASIDFRTFDNDELIRYKDNIAALAAEHALDVTPINLGSPIIFNKESPSVQDFIELLKEELGHEPEFRDSYGASDARFFTPYDIPCILIEPTGGGRHSAEEWMLVDDLPRYYALMERWLLGTLSSNATTLK